MIAFLISLILLVATPAVAQVHQPGFTCQNHGTTLNFAPILNCGSGTTCAWTAPGICTVTASGGGGGTVTNIATTLPITGGPITTTGTIGVNTFGASGASHARGVVPDPGSSAGTTKFLREDATWVVPPGSGPGGTNGQIQYNNSGTFGGGDLTGDVTTSGSLVTTVAKIHIGNTVTGGTATGIPFIDAGGLLAQDLTAFTYDPIDGNSAFYVQTPTGGAITSGVSIFAAQNFGGKPIFVSDTFDATFDAQYKSWFINGNTGIQNIAVATGNGFTVNVQGYINASANGNASLDVAKAALNANVVSDITVGTGPLAKLHVDDGTNAAETISEIASNLPVARLHVGYGSTSADVRALATLADGVNIHLGVVNAIGNGDVYLWPPIAGESSTFDLMSSSNGPTRQEFFAVNNVNSVSLRSPDTVTPRSTASLVFQLMGIAPTANGQPIIGNLDANGRDVDLTFQTSGVTATKTVRNSAGTGTCTFIFTGGVLTGGTC